MQCLTAIRELIIIAATIVATGVAWVGLSTWRSQLRGRTEYDLARRYLRSTYQVRDALQRVRSPFISAEEMGTALKEEGSDLTGINRDEAQKRGQYAAYARRWKEVEDANSNLQLDNLEAEVLWEDLTRDGYKKLTKCLVSLYADLLYLLKYEDGVQTEEQIKIRKRFYLRSGSEKDSFSDELNEAVRDIEKVLRPKLKL